MELYGKSPNPIWSLTSEQFSVDNPKDFTTKQEWLNWQVATGAKVPIPLQDLKQRKQANNEFTIVPRYLTTIPNEGLSMSKKMILADIIGFAKHGMQYYRSNQGIAAVFGLSEGAVKKILRELEEQKLIVKEMFQHPDGSSGRYLRALIKAIKSLNSS